MVIFISFGKHNFTFIKSGYTIAPQGNHAFGGYMLNTNKNLTVENLPNNRAKKLAWMRENYSWHLIFTDCMSSIMPQYARIQIFGFTRLLDTWARIMKGSNDEINGPPTGANTNA